MDDAGITLTGQCLATADGGTILDGFCPWCERPRQDVTLYGPTPFVGDEGEERDLCAGCRELRADVDVGPLTLHEAQHEGQRWLIRPPLVLVFAVRMGLVYNQMTFDPRRRNRFGVVPRQRADVTDPYPWTWFYLQAYDADPCNPLALDDVNGCPGLDMGRRSDAPARLGAWIAERSADAARYQADPDMREVAAWLRDHVLARFVSVT